MPGNVGRRERCKSQQWARRPRSCKQQGTLITTAIGWCHADRPFSPTASLTEERFVKHCDGHAIFPVMQNCEKIFKARHWEARKIHCGLQ